MQTPEEVAAMLRLKALGWQLQTHFGERSVLIGGEAEFNARFKAFVRHWGFRPRACAPNRGAHQSQSRGRASVGVCGVGRSNRAYFAKRS